MMARIETCLTSLSVCLSVCLTVCLFVYMSVCLYVCLSEVTIQLETVYYLCNVIKLSVQFSVMGGTHTGEILPVTALPNRLHVMSAYP